MGWLSSLTRGKDPSPPTPTVEAAAHLASAQDSRSSESGSEEAAAADAPDAAEADIKAGEPVGWYAIADDYVRSTEGAVRGAIGAIARQVAARHGYAGKLSGLVAPWKGVERVRPIDPALAGQLETTSPRIAAEMQRWPEASFEDGLALARRAVAGEISGNDVTRAARKAIAPVKSEPAAPPETEDAPEVASGPAGSASAATQGGEGLKEAFEGCAVGAACDHFGVPAGEEVAVLIQDGEMTLTSSLGLATVALVHPAGTGGDPAYRRRRAAQIAKFAIGSAPVAVAVAEDAGPEAMRDLLDEHGLQQVPVLALRPTITFIWSPFHG